MSDTSTVSRLNRDTRSKASEAEFPPPACFDLPEKILQFGTGAFLRGFATAYVDRAIRTGAFRGRIVVVGSTGSGRTGRINAQDGLYTLCVQGVENGETIDRCRVVGSVSRAIASTEDWRSVLEYARSPELEFVVSNTTEVGIRFDADDRLHHDPPASFPGKLTALLHARAEAFAYDPACGLTILCCELIDDNARTLQSIVLRLAERWNLGDAFSEWVRHHNRFCNTLVDRIVPGRPDPDTMRRLEKRLGYADDLLVQAEPFSFWAIEGDDELRDHLSFVAPMPEVIVTPDITPYRTRKVRILNGAHTAMVPVSLLCGNDTVAETMEDPLTSEFVRRIILEEILPTLDLPDAEEFAHQVLDRFANPFVQHRLRSIALQQTSKMAVRVVPSVRAYVDRTGELPRGLTLAFAAFLVLVTGGDRAADVDLPSDERAGAIRSLYRALGDARPETFVRAVCTDPTLWRDPLDELPGFVPTVSRCLMEMQEAGVRRILESMFHATNGRA